MECHAYDSDPFYNSRSVHNGHPITFSLEESDDRRRGVHAEEAGDSLQMKLIASSFLKGSSSKITRLFG